MTYDLTKDEMLVILAELVQGEHIWRNNKNDLLNFIEEIREKNPITFLEKLIKEHPEIELDLLINADTACPCALGFEEYNPDQTCNIMTCVECWLRKT